MSKPHVFFLLVLSLSAGVLNAQEAEPPAAAAQPTSRADELMLSGADAFRRGEFGKAEQDWKRADAIYTAEGNVAGQLDAWLNIGAVQQQTGKFPAAVTTLFNAHDLAEKGGHEDKLVGIKNAIGVAYTFMRRPGEAKDMLDGALGLAQQRGDAAMEASVRNNLGNLYAAWAEVLKEQGKPDTYPQAFENYTASSELAQKSGDATLAAKAATNAALSAARGGKPDEASDLAAKATEMVRALPDDSLDKANLLIAIGQTHQTLLTDKPDAANVPALQRRAFDAYEQARLLAKAMNNPLAGSYAVGYQGRLYEMAGKDRLDEALTLTRRAVLLAQQAQSNDSLYLWHWQTGRIFKAQGNPEEAISAYTRARDTLQDVRSDQALSYGNRGMKATFRSEVGPLYYELADLLLSRADAPGADQAKVDQYLSDARDTVERLRVGEFESYMKDDCVAQAQDRQINLATELKKVPRGNPAVVYLIPLEDRIEIILTSRGGSQRIKGADVGREQLTQEVRAFRRAMETRKNHKYLNNARQLYDWLIKPIEPVLTSQKIDTLVFVPDGALRTVPMSALHDGNDFLIAKYAVAVSPGLSLTLTDSDPQQVSAGAARVLASGLSVQAPNSKLPPLPSVAEELATIEKIYGSGATKLLNEQFEKPAFEGELAAQQNDYAIVHIASHGVFAADIEDTYVLTYGSPLRLADLEGLLRPYQIAQKPIYLLTLSACQTAASDDDAARERASLGLGGLAVKAGARSAMASLWFANDQATSELVITFYEQLRDNPEDGKAKALQQAQLKLIRGEDFSHPIYWAAFLMIGDWL